MPPQRKSTGSLLPVVLVLVPLVLLIVGVVAFAGRAGLLMLAVVACVPAFMMLHYVLWGYWLSKALHQDEPADSAEPKRDE